MGGVGEDSFTPASRVLSVCSPEVTWQFLCGFVLPEERIVSLIGTWNTEVNETLYILDVFLKSRFSCIAWFLASFFNEFLLL